MIVLRQPYPSPAIVYVDAEATPVAQPCPAAGAPPAAKVIGLLAASVVAGAAAGVALFAAVFGL